MSIFKITDPDTGKVIQLDRDSPPSEEEIEQLFTNLKEQSKNDSDKRIQNSIKYNSKQSLPTPHEQNKNILLKAATEEDEEIEGKSDVLLDVPNLKVDEIKLDVKDLEARVALSASLANLVKIEVGAQVGIASVDLDIKGVEAQALLKVRLKRVYEIIARALETVDSNPNLLKDLLVPSSQESKNSTESNQKNNSVKENSTIQQGKDSNRSIDQKNSNNKGELDSKDGNGKLTDSNPTSFESASEGIDQTIKGKYDEKDKERLRYDRVNKNVNLKTDRDSDRDARS